MTFRIRRGAGGTSALLLVAILLAPGTAVCQKPKTPPLPTSAKYTLDKWEKDVKFREDGSFKTEGRVRVILEDTVTHEKTVLIADDAERTATGDIIVRGAVRIDREDGWLAGRELTYHADTQTGTILQAQVQMAGFTLKGEKVDLLPGRIVQALNASITSCIKERPDYHISAKKLELNASSTRFKASRVTIWLGKARIISLPSLQRSLATGSGSPVPLPGYSGATGFHFHLHEAGITEPNRSLDYDLMIGLKAPPAATVAYETDIHKADEDSSPPRTRVLRANEPLKSAFEITPPPSLRGVDTAEKYKRTSVYGLLTANSRIYNRLRSDIELSRLPEVGVSFVNITGTDTSAGAAQGGSASLFLRPSDWLMNAEIGAGYLHERPSGVYSTRLGMRADAVSPFIRMAGGFHYRFGLTSWAGLYGIGGSHMVIAPEAELDYLFPNNHLFGISYKYEHEIGKSPFLFDSRDIRNEARLRYGHVGNKWAYDLVLNVDLDRFRAYDSSAAIRRRLDCIEYGIQYRTRSQSINLVFNLLPSAPRKNQVNVD